MDELDIVRAELRAKKGQLRKIADETGISYDTVLRIANGEGDPGYSKVATLKAYFCRLHRPFDPVPDSQEAA